MPTFARTSQGKQPKSPSTRPTVKLLRAFVKRSTGQTKSLLGWRSLRRFSTYLAHNTSPFLLLTLPILKINPMNSTRIASPTYVPTRQTWQFSTRNESIASGFIPMTYFGPRITALQPRRSTDSRCSTRKGLCEMRTTRHTIAKQRGSSKLKMLVA